jgi:hypothetical protein
MQPSSINLAAMAAQMQLLQSRDVSTVRTVTCAAAAMLVTLC